MLGVISFIISTIIGVATFILEIIVFLSDKKQTTNYIYVDTINNYQQNVFSNSNVTNTYPQINTTDSATKTNIFKEFPKLPVILSITLILLSLFLTEYIPYMFVVAITIMCVSFIILWRKRYISRIELIIVTIFIFVTLGFHLFIDINHANNRICLLYSVINLSMFIIYSFLFSALEVKNLISEHKHRKESKPYTSNSILAVLIYKKYLYTILVAVSSLCIFMAFTSIKYNSSFLDLIHDSLLNLNIF